MFKGRATAEAAKEFLKRRNVNAGQIGQLAGVPVSRFGVGTYLGDMNETTDLKVSLACVLASDQGCNIFDSAINYRGQRGERSIGEALRRLILGGKASREELFISTKGGFVPFEGKPVSDVTRLFEDEYVSRGIAARQDLIAGCHCMEPGYLSDQIERSRRNLGIETIDLYYIHNPETQLDELPARVFLAKLEAAFVALEIAIKEGRIASYGMATWNGFREEAGAQTALSLELCVSLAEKAADKVGAQRHGLKAIQLPLNLAMPEAAMTRTQRFGGGLHTALEAASTLGIGVALSVPLFQARLCHNLPDFIVEKFPKELSQAQCALAFATGFPGVESAMIGMKQADHVNHNLELLHRRPLSPEELKAVIDSMVE